MLNRIILIGRLTRDPELRYTQRGVARTNFTLAVNRKFNKEETDFIPIVIWNKPAETCANYGSKGRLVFVEGRLQIRTYQDNGGNKRKITEVIADEMRFLDKKPEGKKRQENIGQKEYKEDWSDIGREVSMSDIEIEGNREEYSDEIPF